jgi:hypothetical protein
VTARIKLATRPLAERAWPKVRDYLVPELDVRGWIMVALMALWMSLNVFDLFITYDGMVSGRAYEANRLFSRLLANPLAAVPLKLALAYVVLKLVERVELRTPYSGMTPLLLVNIYLSWACLHNLEVVSGSGSGAEFLRYYPLAGMPR